MLLPEWQGCGVNRDVYRGAVRLAADLFKGRDFVTVDAPLDEVLRVEDGVVGLSSIAARFARTADVIRRLAPSRLFVVGGTCGVELAPVAYLNDYYDGDLAVLWLDAHADLNTPASSPSGHFHGMVLRTLMGEGPRQLTASIARPLQPSQIALAGVRDLDPPERETIAERAIDVIDADTLIQPDAFVDRVHALGHAHLYVHFDVDVLSSAGFHAALMPTPPGGPTLPEVAAAIAALVRDFDVVGFSVLEFCDRDDGSAAAISAALAVFE